MREYRLASREHSPANTVVRVGEPSGGAGSPVEVGGRQIAMMVGPCAVESHTQVMATALAVREAGFPILRGGAFKPRTSPYSFQGLMDEGLRLLDAARRETGLLIVTEVMSEADVDAVARVADILQIGSRSMHAVRLLEAIADAGKPVLLKRGFSATIKEWLLAAEYVMRRNERVILCERGIRSFDDEYTRNVLDLAAVAVAKRETHLPVIVDPSQGTGRADLIVPMCRAAIAAGADGLLIETHPDPGQALCDGDQSLPTSELPSLARQVERMAQAMDRSIYPSLEPLLVGAASGFHPNGVVR
ncbi:MAG TPA: 3-deoxy-7-phosphoheptulonate synthase [Chloroflexota bacterium]|jgi:3-deoxy-7-phosphoheptulonate synthase